MFEYPIGLGERYLTGRGYFDGVGYEDGHGYYPYNLITRGSNDE